MISTPTVFRCRCEWFGDFKSFLTRLPPGEVLYVEAFQKDPFPDTVVTFAVNSLTLNQLRHAMRQVVDGHVMLETVQPKPLYTGDRAYKSW